MGYTATDDSIERLLKRFKRSKSRKYRWQQEVRRALEFLGDSLEEVSEAVQKKEPTQQGDCLYDSTAAWALDGFAANLQGGMFPSGKKYLTLLAGSGVNNKDKSDQQLGLVTNKLFDFKFASNFGTQIGASLMDLAFGMGAYLCHKGTKEQPFVYEAVSCLDIYPEEGPNGETKTVFRETHKPYRDILETWPDATIPDEWKEKMEKDPSKTVCLIEGTVYQDVELMDVKAGEDKKQKGYRYVVFDDKGKEILVDRTQKSSPWVILRWPGRAGTLYKRGPLLKALADVKTLNKVKELLLKKADRDLNGMYTVLDDHAVNIDNIRFGFMNFIPVESNGGPNGPSIAALQSATGMDSLTQFLFSDLQNGIYKNMYAEPLGNVNLPVKSATEIAARQAELSKRIGPAFDRLMYEGQKTATDRELFILNELELVDLGDYVQVDGQIINLQYHSPIAQAEDEDSIQNTMRYVQYLQATYGIQVVMQLVPPDKLAKYLANKLHLEPDIAPTEQELLNFQQAMAAMPQQEGDSGGGGGSGQPDLSNLLNAA